jgi:murein DD-endopeptidase MepM/ murein hydrolase activator NlpD
MSKKIIYLVILLNFLFAAEVKELPWPKGETLLTFLDKYNITSRLYFDLPKEDKELCSEITADSRYYLYEDSSGSLNQVLIPVSEDIQLHIYKDSNETYKFQTLPINYEEFTETIAIPISTSVSYDLQKATGSVALAAQLKAVFNNTVNFRQMRKGNFVVIKYSQKVLMGKAHGLPEILSAMVEVGRSQYFRFKNTKTEKYYDEDGKGYSKIYFFRIPLTYSRISSHFTKKRWHPVLKRYRAHLGTDFAAPRGRKIYAAGDGRVEFIGRRGGYGKTIVINHRNGYKTLYAHMHNYKSGIKRGRNIKKGQHIGYVGSTGLSSGPHLHLGLYKSGRAINPLKVIKRGKRISLSGKDKKKFIANSRNTIKKFKEIIKDENRKQATRLDRLNYKSDIEI